MESENTGHSLTFQTYMTRNKREAQKILAQKKIMESALVMFAQQGLSVSIAKIAEHAGITKQALMYHFPNKSRLLEAVIKEIEHSSLTSLLHFFSLLLDKSNAQKTEQLEEITLLFVENNLWAVLLLQLIIENQESYLPESFRGHHLLIIKELENRQQQGFIQKDIDIAATFTNMNMLLLTTLATARTNSSITEALNISSQTWLKRRISSIFWMYRNTLFSKA